MLILRRKVGERIVIGDGIVVVVNRVAGGRVTLGIEAPSDVHIVRGELRALDNKVQTAAMPLPTGAPADLVLSLAGSASPVAH
jgi:carbon storage regulator